jgi:hypothetical protein
MFFSTKATKYFCNLKTPHIRTPGIELMNPYKSYDVQEVVKKFYSKYYSDNKNRLFMIGINPGRFGGGLTGIAFTDPVALRENCGIDNNFGNRKELSSKFIYKIADKYGGAENYFSNIFLTALYPLAITKAGKNYNYYDDESLAKELKPDIVSNLKEQIKFGARKDMVVLLGKKNADYFKQINDEHKFFYKLIVLEHPRYIMQYKLKKLNSYINKYIKAINL